MNLLEIESLRKYFPLPPAPGSWLGTLAGKRRHVPMLHAVDDVSFVIKAGESVGLVGESGCG